MKDKTYLKQPKFISDELIDAIIERVYEYCKSHKIKTFDFVFHGGEALLAQRFFFEKFVDKTTKKLMGITTPLFFLQTNGTLLDTKWCEFFEKENIHLGISIDGTAESNDRFRVDFEGKGSYQRILNGVNIIKTYPKLNKYLGFLCVIDIEAPPSQVYYHFKSIGNYFVNFLFPIGNYDDLPSGLKKIGTPISPYADWLIEVFDLWLKDDYRKPKIRFFEQILELLIGIDSGTETLGLKNSPYLSLETDGKVEMDSAIRAIDSDYIDKGINIKDYSIDEILASDTANLFFNRKENLPQKCKKCPVNRICGGGYILNRFSTTNQYNNATIYCSDMLKLISHIHNRFRETSPNYQKTTSYIDFMELWSLINLDKGKLCLTK